MKKYYLMVSTQPPYDHDMDALQIRHMTAVFYKKHIWFDYGNVHVYTRQTYLNMQM